MAFCSKVNNSVVTRHQVSNQGFITNVAFDEGVVRVRGDFGEVGESPGVGQRVKHGNGGVLKAWNLACQSSADKIRANETRTACDQQFHDGVLSPTTLRQRLVYSHHSSSPPVARLCWCA